ncbi:serine/threonine-protein kinase [Sorangium sp. So ce1000]|uniref:serine/threonine-protein kinase n=1 Tax=Sorangium sp. So ce1000 TaxID=3133325 RepID=UPI003F627969
MRHEALLGRKVAGRFTITRFLGEGGMASVFVAERDAEPRRVAIKIMNPEFTADRAFIRRFQREAKAAARVKHPNSVKIFEYGVEGALSYIVMELLSGDDLYVLLERHGAIGQARAVRILSEVCEALAVAHEMGVVHRDLKPENIMVVPDPMHLHGERVKVLDFGIAKILDTGSSGDDPEIFADPLSVVTRAGTFVGTPAYMSPEQCGLLPVDQRTDLYTCGVLLFQLVTGRLPFEGETPLHTATLHIHAPVPAPSSCAPGIHPRLEALIVKALAKQPADRYQTARELGYTLHSLLAELPDTAVGLGPISRRQPSSLFSRDASLQRGPMSLPPLTSLPSSTSSPISGPEPRAELSIESARTLVSGASDGEAAPPPPVLLHAPPSELPQTLDPQAMAPGTGAEPQRWAGDSVPEISLQLPSWSHGPSEALLSGNGLAESGSYDDASEDSTLTMVRRDELLGPARVRVHTASYDEGDELDITPPGREVKATLRSAEDFGLGTPEKRAEVGLVRVDSAPVPPTPQSPLLDGGAAAAWDRRQPRLTNTLRLVSSHPPAESQMPTVTPGELQAASPPGFGAMGFGAASAPGAASAASAAASSDAGAAVGRPPSAADGAAPAVPATALPFELAATIAEHRTALERRATLPDHVVVPQAQPAQAQPAQAQPAQAREPSWLAGKRGLIIGFVAGMLLTALAMFLLMRLLS